MESASICPTRARKSYYHFLNEGIKDSVAKYVGAFTSLVPGAIVNGIVLANSGEKWKEVLAGIALTNAVSGFYEMGRGVYHKRRNSQKPVEWKEIEE